MSGGRQQFAQISIAHINQSWPDLGRIDSKVAQIDSKVAQRGWAVRLSLLQPRMTHVVSGKPKVGRELPDARSGVEGGPNRGSRRKVWATCRQPVGNFWRTPELDGIDGGELFLGA